MKTPSHSVRSFLGPALVLALLALSFLVMPVARPDGIPAASPDIHVFHLDGKDTLRPKIKVMRGWKQVDLSPNMSLKGDDQVEVDERTGIERWDGGSRSGFGAFYKNTKGLVEIKGKEVTFHIDTGGKYTFWDIKHSQGEHQTHFQTREARGGANGTGYLVLAEVGRTLVAVVEGSVEVTLNSDPTKQVIVEAGQEVEATQAALGTPRPIAATSLVALDWNALVPFANPDPHRAGEVMRNPTDRALMVWIPQGSYLMGANADEINNLWTKFHWPEKWKQDANTQQEGKMHLVRLERGFWMYQGPVTNAMFKRFLDANPNYRPDSRSSADEKYPADHQHFKDKDLPVVDVSRRDSEAYCKWAGGRLPWEAEWEYAARGGNTGLAGHPRRTFVWGDALPEAQTLVGNVADETFRAAGYPPSFPIFPGYRDGEIWTSKAGRFPANGFKLQDMAGNVFEWCADHYSSGFPAGSVVTDPQGPETGTLYVVRGSSWSAGPALCRLTYREAREESFHADGLGFRAVKPEP